MVVRLLWVHPQDFQLATVTSPRRTRSLRLTTNSSSCLYQDLKNSPQQLYASFYWVIYIHLCIFFFFCFQYFSTHGYHYRLASILWAYINMKFVKLFSRTRCATGELWHGELPSPPPESRPICACRSEWRVLVAEMIPETVEILFSHELCLV